MKCNTCDEECKHANVVAINKYNGEATTLFVCDVCFYQLKKLLVNWRRDNAAE